MSTYLITGGTGLIGKALTEMLIKQGHRVIILSRSLQTTDTPQLSYALWDIEKQQIDEKAIAYADYIFHLAGAGVADKRWSAKRKKEIRESRIKSSELLVKAMTNFPNKVKAVISASATGWYGEDKKNMEGKNFFTEEQPSATDFLGETCLLWEKSLDPIAALGIRVVKLRTGIVFSNNGGAFAEFKKPLKMGIASILGSGKQIISWIHITDLCRMYLFAAEHERVNGSYNAVSPMPVTNKNLMMLMAKKMRDKFFISIHVPTFVLKVMLGEMSVEVLKSTTVSSAKIKNAGFTFFYPSIEAATDDLLK